MKNLLDAAASCDDRDKAVQMIADALNIIVPNKLEHTCVTWPARWKAFDRYARLVMLADWIKAECFDLMDMVPVTTEISTKGD